MTTKHLTTEDIALAKELFTWYLEDDELEGGIASDEYLMELLAKNDFHVWVALDGDKLAGGITAYELPEYKVQGNELFIYEVGVKAEYRRQGVATMLINAALEMAKALNITEVFVDAEADNEPAKALYKATLGTDKQVVEYTKVLR